MRCQVCNKEFAEGQVVFSCMETDVVCCDKKCCDEYDEFSRKQKTIGDTWQKKAYVVKRLESDGCFIRKAVLQMKDDPIVQVILDMPPDIELNRLIRYSGEEVTVTFQKGQLVSVDE